MSRETVTVWITRYALTFGVKKCEAEITEFGGAQPLNERHAYYHGEGRDWHRSRTAALVRAEKMRKAKLASLRKSITKLESLSFDGTPE